MTVSNTPRNVNPTPSNCQEASSNPWPGGLRAAAAAEYIGVSKRFLYDLRKRDGFPPPRLVGQTPVWLRTELDDWLARQPQQPQPQD